MPSLHEQTTIPLCRHIRTSGNRCRSASISGQDFCYFHVRLHKDHPAPLAAQQIVNNWNREHVEAWRLADQDPLMLARAYPDQNELNFPPLEDPESVQLAGSMLFHALAQGKIHPVRARILLDVLRIVTSSMRKSGSSTPFDPADTVRHVVESETGVTLAPLSSAPHKPFGINILG